MTGSVEVFGVEVQRKVGDLLHIDHERVGVGYEHGAVTIRVQGMTHREFFRWAPRLYRTYRFCLRLRSE